MTTSAHPISAVEPVEFSAAEAGSYFAAALPLLDKVLDVAAVTAAVLMANLLERVLQLAPPSHSLPVVLLCGAGFGLLFVTLLERHGGYAPCVSLLAIRETERILRVTLQSFCVAIVVAYFADVEVLRLGFALALILVPLFLVLEKWQAQKLVRALRVRGYATRRALILGTGSAARRIYTALVRSPKFGVEPVAFVEEEDAPTPPQEIYECSYQRKHSARVLSGPLCPELFRQFQASVLIVADSVMDRQSMLLTAAKASAARATTYFAAQEFLEPGHWVDYTAVDDIMLAHVSPPASRVFSDAAKRILDVAAAACALVVFAPFGVVIAMLVKCSSPGPVLFRQRRVGKDGQVFSLYKFRTMFCDVPRYGYSPVAGEDPRVTPIGRRLRRTSLDELPQLINVLWGDMSLVGPRPEMPFIVEQYDGLQRQRLTVKPGMTGLWQISADRAFLIHQNPEYDLYFIDDCLEGLLRLMASDYREPLNLGTEEMVSVDQLVDMVCKVAGKTLTKQHELDRPQGVRGRNSDNTRLRTVLGWEPRTPLAEGLNVTYRWIEEELRRAGRLQPALAYASD